LIGVGNARAVVQVVDNPVRVCVRLIRIAIVGSIIMHIGDAVAVAVAVAGYEVERHLRRKLTREAGPRGQAR
jgi:hypothetical protein